MHACPWMRSSLAHEQKLTMWNQSQFFHTISLWNALHDSLEKGVTATCPCMWHFYCHLFQARMLFHWWRNDWDSWVLQWKKRDLVSNHNVIMQLRHSVYMIVSRYYSLSHLTSGQTSVSVLSGCARPVQWLPNLAKTRWHVWGSVTLTSYRPQGT